MISLLSLCGLLATCHSVYSASVSPYMVGGTQAREGQFPFMVAVQDTDDYSHICGGSILNKKWILTAAHCVYELQPIDLYVRAGSTNNDRDHGTRYFVEERVFHQNFSFETKDHDIAVLKIELEFDLDDKLMQTVELVEEFVGSEKEVTAMGWGLTDLENRTWPNDLQFLEAKSTSNELCKLLDNTVKETEMCIYGNQNEGHCHSDGGGPLVYKGTNHQIGVGTYDKNCNIHNEVKRTYTRVSQYIDWIHQHTDSWDL